jgi:N-ethylmaleimide reductase
MAPLTRDRAGPRQTPTALMVEYYAQRAGAGLIVTEATQISAEGQGYLDTPGVYSDEQIAGWRRVTDAVHARGGTIVVQLWHVGRISHVSLQPNGQPPVSSTARAANGKTFTKQGFVPVSAPRALREDELPRIVADYRHAARSALASGFDGVEVHGANGYLIEQFLQSRSNQRTDRYGGSIANRVRFLLEVTQAVIDVYGADRVGVRLSPYGIANGSGEPDPMPLYTHAVEALNKLGLAYLHLIEPRSSGAGRADVNWQNVPSAMALFRPLWNGVLIAAGGFVGETAEAAIAAGHADAVAFGRYFISNPDLPRRLAHGFPLTPYNRPTFYGGEEKGYTDYPVYDEMAEA